MKNNPNRPVVELDDVIVKFRDVTAVDGVSLSIKEGELLTLLGPSGCGKTTTLRSIAGFEKPSSGSIRIGNEEVSNVPPYQRNAGMVFQDYALFPHMSVADNIGFGLQMKGVSEGEVKRRVQDILSLIQLPDIGGRYPAELSGGQQQRVALARATIIEPKVLLLDEPLSDLDKKLRQDMRMEILRIHRELGATMAYVTHNQEEALMISDRMAVMSEGKIRQIGTPQEIYQNPNDKFVADFIGDANLLPGKLVERDNNYIINLDIGKEVMLPKTVPANSSGSAGGSTVNVLVRPESFHVGEHEANTNSIMLTGKIEEATFLGSKWNYYIDVGGERVHAQHNSIQRDSSFEMGDKVELSFDRNSPALLFEDSEQ